MKASKKLIEANQRIGKQLRQKALDNYYTNPKKCLNCGGVLIVKEDQRVADVRLKKFCSKSCSAQYNNRLYPKRIRKNTVYKKTLGDELPRVFRICEECGAEFEAGRSPCGRIRIRRFCSSCLGFIRKERARESHKQNGTARPDHIENMTKGGLKEFYSGNHYRTKVAITNHARVLYKNSNKPKECFLCSYKKIYIVAHIKAVAEYEDSTLVSEINNLNNLVALCPNHHEEYDKRLLELADRKKIAVVAQSGRAPACRAGGV